MTDSKLWLPMTQHLQTVLQAWNQQVRNLLLLYLRFPQVLLSYQKEPLHLMMESKSTRMVCPLSLLTMKHWQVEPDSLPMVPKPWQVALIPSVMAQKLWQVEQRSWLPIMIHWPAVPGNLQTVLPRFRVVPLSSMMVPKNLEMAWQN